MALSARLAEQWPYAAALGVRVVLRVRRSSGAARESPPQALRQQLVQGDRQGAHANASRVIDRIGDSRGGADDAELPDTLGAHGPDVRIVFVDPGHVNGAHISVSGDVVLSEIMVDEVAEV